jgi:hypothetical protein
MTQELIQLARISGTEVLDDDDGCRKVSGQGREDLAESRDSSQRGGDHHHIEGRIGEVRVAFRHLIHRVPSLSESVTLFCTPAYKY